jgi:glycosyltransferase involved in cell wall biosynthesis
MPKEVIDSQTNSKRVLYISHDGMTDSLGQSQVLPYIIGLSKYGYQISLISLEKKEKFSKLELEIHSLCKSNNIEWHPISYTDSIPVLKTLIDLIRISKKAKSLHQINNFNLIHCRSYLPTMVALQLKKKWNVPILFDIRGFWLDERVEGKVWSKKNPIIYLIYNILKIKEIQLFKKTEGLVSLTNKAIPTIKKYIGNSTINKIIEVIPCCVDTDFFNYNLIEKTNQQFYRQKLKIDENDFVLTYLGSLSTWYMPNEMFDFFKILSAQKKGAKFLIITHEDPTPYLKIASEKGIDLNKIVFTSAQRKEVPTLISLSNASIFFIIPTFSKSASSPTKLGELLGMGIPVICNAGVGDTDAIIRDTKTGIVVNEFNNINYDETIDELLKTVNAYDKKYLRKQAIEFFGLEKGIATYLKVYKKLLN